MNWRLNCFLSHEHYIKYNLSIRDLEYYDRLTKWRDEQEIQSAVRVAIFKQNSFTTHCILRAGMLVLLAWLHVWNVTLVSQPELYFQAITSALGVILITPVLCILALRNHANIYRLWQRDSKLPAYLISRVIR